jgi:saccharopine dehydrogenase-like NADP-dependent oxidoreductase
MQDILVIGAGKIGVTIADLLLSSGDYRVDLADQADTALDQARHSLARHPTGLTLAPLDVGQAAALARRLTGKQAVISAAPYHVTTQIAQAAVANGVHYLDLTEDVAQTRTIRALAGTARSALIPQCGLAPGFISIVAQHLVDRFDQVETVRLRTGALPQYPANGLNYNLTWSTDGVINEYCQPCEAIAQGVKIEVPALEECENFSLDGVRYEAFNTSGGLGSLCDSLQGRVRELNYRSIRYPGHGAIMKVLLQDLRLSERRGVLKDILEQALPATSQDVVVIFVTVTGQRAGRLLQESYAHKIYSRAVDGQPRTAIQATTAAGICAVLDLLLSGALPDRGVIRQEQVGYDRFIANRFGQIYAPDVPLMPLPCAADTLPALATLARSRA